MISLKNEIINVQTFDTKEKYVVGSYDVETLTLPRLIIEDIKVNQSTTTTVEIPLPGTLVLQYPSTGYGSLYVIRDGEPVWFYNLIATGNQEILRLLPGNYLVVYRARHHTRSFYTIEQYFTIETLKTTRLNLSTHTLR